MREKSLKEVAESRLREFVADAIEKAGGTERLAAELEKLGFTGQQGQPYNPGSIANWKGGRRQPDAEVVFALARHYDISLDRYVFGEEVPPGIPETVEEHGQRLGLLEGWLHELAAHLGVELGDVGSHEAVPSLTIARMEREVAALRADVDRLRLREQA